MDDNIHKLNLLYSLLDSSSHPISKSVKKELIRKYPNLELKSLEDVKTINSKGVSAKYKNIDGKEFELLGGNIELMRDNNIWYKFDSSNSVYLFAINKKVIATFELVDEIKENAKDLITYLKEQNLEVIMLTGDNEQVANKISNKLGIEKFYASQTPITKADYIK